MDDRHAQFLITLGELCTAASLAGLEVEMRPKDERGRIARGVPSAGAPDRCGEDSGDAGYPHAIAVDDRLVDLEDVRACTIYAPGSGPRR